MNKLVLALLLSLLSATAYAGGSTWADATITSIKVMVSTPSAPKGYLLVTFAANGAGTPSCASGYPRNVVIDLSQAGGGFAAAIVQSTFLMSGPVTVTGTGACNVVSNTETIATISEAPLGPLRTYNGATTPK